MSDDITIRVAEPEDSAVLTEVAYRSKGYWDYNPESLDQWAGPLDVTPEYIEANPTFVACGGDDEVLGFCSLLCDDGRWELDHMWVVPETIGTGLGAKLFLVACEEAEVLGAESLWILSDPNAEGFYKRMGASRIGGQETTVDGVVQTLPILSIKLTPRYLPINR